MQHNRSLNQRTMATWLTLDGSQGGSVKVQPPGNSEYFDGTYFNGTAIVLPAELV